MNGRVRGQGMSSYSSTESHPSTAAPRPSGGKVTGFVVLTILAVAICGAALYLGNAPVKSPFLSDWFGWARGDRTWSGVLIVSLIMLLTGAVGTVVRLISNLFFGLSRPRAPKAPRVDRKETAERPVATPAEFVAVPTENSRGSLKFDAGSLSAAPAAAAAPIAESRPIPAPEPVRVEPAPVIAAPVFVEAAAIGMQSLEPAIFSDNASDSFLTRDATVETRAPAAFDPNAALADTHGLQVTPQPMTAQVIPIRPEVQIVAPEAMTPEPEPIVVAAAPIHDPVEAALLADAPLMAPRAVPASDINAVISSAMRFIETPEPQLAGLTPVEEIPGAAMPAPVIAPAIAPVAEPAAEQTPEATNGFQTLAAAMEPTDDQSIIRQAVQMALSVWPDTTRAIAADELNVRVSYLYYDKATGSRQAFQQIANGDLSAAAVTLQTEADNRAAAGAKTDAAEIWRVVGALNMGRDDGKALMAYEKVSELDPTDANIHVYLARRYQMNSDTGKMLPVLGRALAVVGDPATRLEMLSPYADLLMKSGNLKSAGDAFEELGRLHETRAYLKPDDMQARSAQGISLARGAQAREMQGAHDLAGPLYKKAHRVFADLSAQMPEHAGLRTMADNALRDAQRFNMA